MKKSVMLALALATSVGSTSVSAEESKVQLNPWSDCGIGAMVFPETPVGAAISNIIWDLGTTAVTSAGVSKDSCQGSNVQAAVFIQQSYDQMIVDAANGEGEYLAAVLGLLECNADTTAIRNGVAVTLNDVNYSSHSQSEKAESFYNVVMAQCTAA